jgi:hypothetical protein
MRSRPQARASACCAASRMRATRSPAARSRCGLWRATARRSSAGYRKFGDLGRRSCAGSRRRRRHRVRRCGYASSTVCEAAWWRRRRRRPSPNRLFVCTWRGGRGPEATRRVELSGNARAMGFDVCPFGDVTCGHASGTCPGGGFHAPQGDSSHGRHKSSSLGTVGVKKLRFVRAVKSHRWPGQRRRPEAGNHARRAHRGCGGRAECPWA